MKGKFFVWLKGSVYLRITGSFCERFLNLCAYHNIYLWDLKPVENGYEAGLSLFHFRKIRPLVKKCHIHVRILRRSGLPFFLFRYRKRKLLFVSLALAFALILGLSLFIWDIRVEGNLSVTDERIVDYLRQEGIHQGISKFSLNYKQLAADLRQAFPEITWVSVKLQGTRLMIDLQENQDRQEAEPQAFSGPSSIVSDVDGVVVKMVTRAGTPMVKAGDEIRKGDLLVSGVIDLINDSNEVYSHQLVTSDADIYVKTSQEYEERILLKQQEKTYSGREKSRVLLKFGALHLGIPFLGQPFAQYDCVTTEKQFRLMENFYLPVYFSRIAVREYEITDKILAPQQARQQAAVHLENFLKKIEEKGVQIFQNNVKIETTDSFCTATGSILLIQKAGRQTAVEITDMQKEGTPTE